jgi:DNA polymerase/3'-5' exonuclease PolX
MSAANTLQCPNQELVDQLRVIQRARRVEGDESSALSYAHVTAALQAYPRPLQSYQEAMQLKGVGQKIGWLIRGFMESGTIGEVQQIKADRRLQTLERFEMIFGVGPQTAVRWYDQDGCREIEDLRQRRLLTSTQLLYLEHLDDLSTP